jgi:hypothetical protein
MDSALTQKTARRAASLCKFAVALPDRSGARSFSLYLKGPGIFYVARPTSPPRVCGAWGKLNRESEDLKKAASQGPSCSEVGPN